MLSKRGLVGYAGMVALVFVLTNVPSYRKMDYCWFGDDFKIDALKHHVGFPWPWFEMVEWEIAGNVSPSMRIPGYFPGTRVIPPALISDGVVAAAIAALLLLLYRTFVARFLPSNVRGLWWRMLIVVGWGVAIVALISGFFAGGWGTHLSLWLGVTAAVALLFILIPFPVAMTLVRYGSYFLTVAGVLLLWFTMVWLLISGVTITNGRISGMDELPMMIGFYLFLALLSSLPVIGLTMVRRWRMDKVREAKQSGSPNSAPPS